MSAPVPVAVIGYGSSATTFHIPFILALPEHFTLHAIQQRPGSKSGPPASKAHPNVNIISSFEEVISGPTALPKPGLIVVTTSNALHYPFAKAALEAGYHVVVEKPITWRVSEAEELASMSSSRGLVCASFNNRRWDCDFLTVQSLFQHPVSRPEEPSALGEPVYFESRFDRYRPYSKGGWREQSGFDEGGGLLLDLGSHLADQQLTLFGPPTTITAFVRNQRSQLAPVVDDDFHIISHYSPSAPLPPSSPAAGTRLAGLRAVLSATVLSPHIDADQPRFRVSGTRGSYEKKGTDPQENQLKAGFSPLHHPPGGEFGLYHPTSDPEELRLGRLTTTADTGSEGKGGPPTQPRLISSQIPTLPGDYRAYWLNISSSILAAEKARTSSGSHRAAQEAVEATLVVKPRQAAMCIRFLNLARKSALEGRTVQWTEPV